MTTIDLVLTIVMAIIVATAARTKNQNTSTPSLSTCSLPETQTGTPGIQTHASVSAGATTSTITCYCHHQYLLRPYKPAYRRKTVTALTIQPIRHPRVSPSVNFAATNTAYQVWTPWWSRHTRWMRVSTRMEATTHRMGMALVCVWRTTPAWHSHCHRILGTAG